MSPQIVVVDVETGPGGPTVTEIPAVPTELYWSPSLHASQGWGLYYSTLDGDFVRPSRLPADAVRLVPDTGQARDPEHLVTQHWDAAGGDVLYRTCSCGEEWTRDEERCPEDDDADLQAAEQEREDRRRNLVRDVVAAWRRLNASSWDQGDPFPDDLDRALDRLAAATSEAPAEPSGDTVQAPAVAALPPEVVAVIEASRAWVANNHRAGHTPTGPAARLDDAVCALLGTARALLGTDTTTEETP